MNLPNLISFSRIPLAFCFLHTNGEIRTCVLFLAMLSDALDGFLARYFKQTSKLGTWLDPLADKFFVFFILMIFLKEGKLDLQGAALFLSRDFALLTYTLYLVFSSKIKTYQVKPFICGKITTALQFFTLIALVFGIPFSQELKILFFLLGIGSLIELFFRKNQDNTASG